VNPRHIVEATSSRMLRRLALGTPRPVQKFALSALQRLARRWPLLSRLIGLIVVESSGAPPETEPVPAAAAYADTVVCLVASEDPVVRARAARDLAHSPAKEVTAALIAALRDPVAEVAVEAATALRGHSPEFAAAALSEVLENRDGFFSASTRTAAVRALGGVLPRGQGKALAAATRDTDATVSLAAIGALVDRDEQASADALLGLLEDTTGFYLPLTRQAAARGLSQIRHTSQGRIGTLLHTESDSVVRDALGAATS
jgi:HEAT repeat protein